MVLISFRSQDNYTNLAGMWLVGEDMPRESNRITLNKDAKDQYGLPAPNVHFDDHPNDIAMRNHAFAQGEKVYQAAVAIKTFLVPRYMFTGCLNAAYTEPVMCLWPRAT